MSEARIASLEARLSSLEVQVNALRRHILRTTGPAEQVEPAVLVQPRKTVQAETVQMPYEPLPEPRINFEAFFGGRFLLGAGVLAFLIGVGFFLKYAFDNGWIGPSGRVAMGLIGGIAMMLAGNRLFRSQRLYASSIAGLGSAILYLSLWACGSYFHLAPPALTFAAMIVVTAGTMTIAIRRDVQALAFVALTGGLLTPALNAGPETNLIALFSYLAVLNLAMLWLPAKRWPQLEAAALAGSQLYLLIDMPYNITVWTSATTTTLTFASIFLLQFTAMPLLRAARAQKVLPFEIVMTITVATLYYVVLFVQFYTAHRHWLTAASVLLAIAYLIVARMLSGHMRQATAAIALAFITVGVGVSFTGASMILAWSIEGVALLVIGTRTGSLVTRSFGYAAFLLTFSAMNVQHLAGGAPFANERFLTLVVIGFGLGAVAYATQGVFDNSASLERYTAQSAEALANVFLLLAVGYELSSAFADSPLAISLWMLLYAAALVGVGFAAKRLFTRWEGLALFGALLVKVFLVDLSSLDTIVRIVSFLAVGSVLLIVALLYQRAQARGSEIA